MKKKHHRLFLSTALLALIAFSVPIFSIPAGASTMPAPVLVLGIHPGSPNGAVVVKPGETIEGIARRYDLSAHDLAALNSLTAPFTLWSGERLLLPVPRTHTVGANDTLYNLSRMYGAPLARLAEANHLKAPYRLYPGQVLHIPRAGESVAEKPAPRAAERKQLKPGTVKTTAASETQNREKVRLLKKPGPSKPHQAFSAMIGKLAGGKEKKEAPRHPAAPAAFATNTKTPSEAGHAPETGVSYSRRTGFVWPVRGQVISSYGPKEGGLYNDGINIAAPRGTPVAAAADGVVAYVGDTLRSYGNLVLIRHGRGMVTAYAHLNTVTVRAGMHVTRGQTIGSVGSTGTVAHAQLHFEVRRGTEKINPQQYLG